MNLIKSARKLIILVVGSTVVLIGLVMIVTPGPAVIFIPLGLALLGTEFVWAKRLLKKIRSKGEWMVAGITGRRRENGNGSGSKDAA